MRSLREMSATRFVAVAAAVNALLYHVPLYRYAFDNLDLGGSNGILTFATLLVLVYLFSAVALYLTAIVAPWLLKPLCILSALASAVAVYFVSTYGVILDRSMMSNVLNTRSEESLDFLHSGLLLYLFSLGLLPALLLITVRIARPRRLPLAGHAIGLVALALLVTYVNSSTWLWFDKHSRRLGGAIMPWSYMVNTARALAVKYERPEELALLPPATLPDDDGTLVVLVLGETARASNFSLYGYERETNPRLAEENVAVLENATSCSTYTTASLHCILSHTGKSSGNDEVLPSYLQRQGVDVIWRSDNWGEPTLVVDTYLKASELRASCTEGERCAFDDVLLSGLKAQMEGSENRNVFVTLHTKGSHGPSYHSRYPPAFDVFEPVCRSVDLDTCSEQALINAYDNTILYTDDFLGRAIELLKSMGDRRAVLVYVSDHGESLGEFGLYLHGTPYAIAPDVQKDIPFLVWMSDRFRRERGIDVADLEKPELHTHAQVFHSVLGAFGIDSEVYERRLDVFAP